MTRALFTRSKKMVCKKRASQWIVVVPAGWVSETAFVAPFRSFDAAMDYIRYWSNNERPGSE